MIVYKMKKMKLKNLVCKRRKLPAHQSIMLVCSNNYEKYIRVCVLTWYIMRSRYSDAIGARRKGNRISDLEKSEFDPTKLIEFLGVMVDSQAMTLSLPIKKVQKLKKLCQNTLTSKQVTLHELSSLIGKLRATAPAILVAPLQLRYLQNLLKRGQQLTWNYGTLVPLDKDCVIELKWWKENLGLCKGKPLLIDPPDIIIQSDAAKTGGWGASCGPTQTGGTWNVREASLDINIQELIAAELAIKTFTKSTKVKSIHIQIDNTAALSYLIKMGGQGTCI